MNTMTPEQFDRAYGAMLGAAIGDSCGSVIEFYRGGPITEKVAQHAMTFPGGGQLRIAGGQVTDDFELTMSMANALIGKDPNKGFPLDDVAWSYIKWYKSRPFDMGGTCAKAFSSYQTFDRDSGYSMGQHMQNVSGKLNDSSQANGALMRASALAVWGWNLPTESLIEYAKLDASLSHPNKVTQECNAIYVMAMVYLINHPGDSNGALAMVENYIQANQIEQSVYDWVMVDSKKSIDEIKCNVNIGWVKHAFILAIHFLRFPRPFEQVLQEVLMKAGDVDTNACIVGGLMGALFGETTVPGDLKYPVLNFRPDLLDESKEIGYNRPLALSPYNLKQTVRKLWDYQYGKHMIQYSAIWLP